MSKHILIFIIGVFLYTPLLQAQVKTQPADTTLQFEEVVIQASKTSVSVRETARPVQIINRRQIEQNSGNSISHLLHHQSGVRVNNSMGSPGNNQDLFLQGAGASYTLILVNGVALNDPSGIGGAIDFRLLPLHNIERIEILKGNQSTLYGADALAGVINIITKDSAASVIEPSGTIEYGAYNSFRASADISGSVRDQMNYSFGYSRKSSDGISAAAAPEGSAESFDDDGFSRDSFYGNLSVRPVPELNIKPFLRYSAFEGDYDADAFTDAPNTFSVDMLNPGVQALFEQDRFRLNATYQLVNTERKFLTEFGETVSAGNFHNLDAFLNVQLNRHVNIMTGLNWQEGILPEDEESDIPEVSTSFTSPYGTILFDAGNGIRAEAGFRMNIHSEYGHNSTYSFSPSYRISENLKLFASIGTGFKTPSLDQLFGQFGANPELLPEESRSIQAGIEAYFFDQTLKLESHYFDRRIDDLIVYHSAAGYVNRDRENTKGVELAANWLLNNHLTFGGFYNYLNGEVLTLNDSGDEQSDSNLIRLPEHNFGLNASCRFSNGLLIKVDGELAGKRADLFFNPANNYESEEVSLDSYLLANFYTEYPVFNQSLTFYATVRNLFDTQFTEVYGYNTMGIHARGGLRFRL